MLTTQRTIWHAQFPGFKSRPDVNGMIADGRLLVQLKDEVLDLLAASAVMIASRQGEHPGRQPNEAEMEAVLGMQVCPCLTTLAAPPCVKLHGSNLVTLKAAVATLLGRFVAGRDGAADGVERAANAEQRHLRHLHAPLPEALPGTPGMQLPGPGVCVPSGSMSFLGQTPLLRPLQATSLKTRK